MKAKCSQKHEEEETEKEYQEEEGTTVEEEKMKEQYTVVNRKKSNTDSPPRSPRNKRKASGEEKQSEKQENKNEKRKMKRRKEYRREKKEMIATQNKRQTEIEMPATEEGIGEERRRVTPKRKNLRTMVQYPKSVEIEKKIAKMKNVMRVKLAAKEDNEGLNAVLLEKERGDKLTELFGERIEMTGIQICCDKLPPVVAFEYLMEYIL
uniref:Uncharacterized protein n=1 Tax=Octopus bimaculoides TaxID=37653 RepID=A0A0L8GKB5_OCTBM